MSSRQQGKRSTQRDWEQIATGGSSCPDCGKVRYLTKGEARRASRRIKGRVGRLGAYRCGDFWHLGHLPPAVVAGHLTRDNLGRRTP